MFKVFQLIFKQFPHYFYGSINSGNTFGFISLQHMNFCVKLVSEILYVLLLNHSPSKWWKFLGVQYSRGYHHSDLIGPISKDHKEVCT